MYKKLKFTGNNPILADSSGKIENPIIEVTTTKPFVETIFIRGKVRDGVIETV